MKIDCDVQNCTTFYRVRHRCLSERRSLTRDLCEVLVCCRNTTRFSTRLSRLLFFDTATPNTGQKLVCKSQRIRKEIDLKWITLGPGRACALPGPLCRVDFVCMCGHYFCLECCIHRGGLQGAVSPVAGSTGVSPGYLHPSLILYEKATRDHIQLWLGTLALSESLSPSISAGRYESAAVGGYQCATVQPVSPRCQ